ncbi:MAG: bifunctional DNA-binding transcriptional regulator/O6-methylguanine-DNA methyltransferase Ada [Myxococcales bacterium]|nr:bifunctional DNA-binding transcriptional regulator/O6-methylguanine-DNA methyltransferase Ada [Myxococcales bacterium]
MDDDDDEKRWEAVAARDATADGSFYFGVRTTGIFCRPGCTARTPRKANVVYFESTSAAERAGYRACKRCRPLDAPSERALAARIARACRLLSRQQPIETRELAALLGMSCGHFQRLFKRQLGVTPQQYRRRVRSERARSLLSEASSVTDSLYEAGFESKSAFYASLGAELGMRPAAARAAGDGELIYYTSRDCSLGVVLVAWTTHGVCSVTLGDAQEPLLAELEAWLPRARFEAGEDCAWVMAVVDAVDGNGSGQAQLPLDMRGTAFQERVWQTLRSIPAGETRSYQQIAESLGQPGAARAVGAACARNRLAVIVPCHRVLQSDGGLAGYRWGRPRKETLLAREREPERVKGRKR